MSTVLCPQDFTFLAKDGLGRTSSAVAHSMVEFEGRLFVGTTAPSPWDDDAKPCILVRDGASGDWSVAYDPPRIEMGARAGTVDVQMSGDGGIGRRRQAKSVLPVDFGYRSMIVFQGKSDDKPCLYVTSMSLLGGRILRSEDGKRFKPVGRPGLGNSEILSFRCLTRLGGKLFSTAVGHVTDTDLDRNMAPEARVYVTDDPASGKWQNANTPGFDDDTNESVFSLGTCGDFVYAGTGNPKRGFQLWRTKGKGKAPFAWERVLTDGAYRYGFNFCAATLTEFDGALYVGGGITGFGYDKPNDIGPVASELIRLNADDSWDLIFGEARCTPDGLKIPYSGMGPGPDDPYDSVIWSMTVHDGVLYAGTHNWEPFAVIGDPEATELTGGYHLWGSADGESWSMVLNGQDHNPCETGVRTLCSTEGGLVVGTLNHARLVKLLGRVKKFAGDLSGYADGFNILLGKPKG